MITKVAVVQASPVLFNKYQTIEKVSQLVNQAMPENPDLIVFPESFIPAYPRGLTFGTVVGSRSDEGREVWLRYAENSIQVPSPDTDFLGELAKKAGAYLVIGVTEKSESGTLYCTVLYFNPEGVMIGKHRKLKPTAAERIIWGEGDGSDLETYPTPFGRIGGLVCWENYMPLARTFLYEQGIDIYIAPTADERDTWQATMKHIATESRCYVLGCNQFVRKADYPTDLYGERMENFPTIMSRGGSVIIDPLGKIVAGPIWDREEILFAELSSEMITKARMDFDPVGHYARSDVFELKKK